RGSADEAGGGHDEVDEVALDGLVHAAVLAVAGVAVGLDGDEHPFLELVGQPPAALEGRDGVAGGADDHYGPGAGPGDRQLLDRLRRPERAVVAVGAGLAEAGGEARELRRD